jgi:hypothetical protein
MCYTDGMLKTVVVDVHVGVVGSSELFQASEALYLRRVHDGFYNRTELNASVNLVVRLMVIIVRRQRSNAKSDVRTVRHYWFARK